MRLIWRPQATDPRNAKGAYLRPIQHAQMQAQPYFALQLAIVIEMVEQLQQMQAGPSSKQLASDLLCSLADCINNSSPGCPG